MYFLESVYAEVGSCLYCFFFTPVYFHPPKQRCEKVAGFSDFSSPPLWAAWPRDCKYLLGIYCVPGLLPPRTGSPPEWVERSGIDSNSLRRGWERRLLNLHIWWEDFFLYKHFRLNLSNMVELRLRGSLRGGTKALLPKGEPAPLWLCHRWQTLDGRRGQQLPEAHRLFLAAELETRKLQSPPLWLATPLQAGAKLHISLYSILHSLSL